MPGLFHGTSLERPVTCEHCGKAEDECRCPRNARGEVRVPREQEPRVRRERRRGKWSTVITGLEASPDEGSSDLKPLLKTLRTGLGTGGGLGEAPDSLVIQGDHRDAVVERLRAMGYRAKAAGG